MHEKSQKRTSTIQKGKEKSRINKPKRSYMQKPQQKHRRKGCKLRAKQKTCQGKICTSQKVKGESRANKHKSKFEQ